MGGWRFWDPAEIYRFYELADGHSPFSGRLLPLLIRCGNVLWMNRWG